MHIVGAERRGEELLRDVECRICGHGGEHKVYVVSEMMFGSGEQFTYFQCGHCGCLQLKDAPQDMSKYYPGSYYSFGGDLGKKYRNPVIGAVRRFFDHHTVFAYTIAGSLVGRSFPNKKLSFLSRLDLTRDALIMDVGCGSGSRLYALREIGFRNLLGIDPYIDRTIEYDNGLRILGSSIHDVPGEWDVIMYNHSFEHIADPVKELHEVFRKLRKGGICLLRVPTVSSYAWEHYREDWMQIDAPRHYYLHSVESMKILADRTGFVLRDVFYDSTLDQFRGSELYRRGIPLFPADATMKQRAFDLFTRSQLRDWKRKAKRLNRKGRGDQAAFYLLKM